VSVTTIISNFNGARFLPRLLETLAGQQGVEHQIIVVDRQSTDESRTILRGYPAVQVLDEPPQTGLVSGYVAGVPHARHEHLFFCNEDMWFEPDCLRFLEQQIDLDQRIGAADPWQWTYDGKAWIHGGVRFRPARWAISSVYPRRTYDFTVDLPPGAVVPFPCAGAFLIHRRVYDDIGGWDRSFFLDEEDIDLSIRAWQRGWRVVTEPRARVYHAVGASNAQTLAAIRQRVSERRYISSRSNQAIIAAKYFSRSHLPIAFLAWIVMFANNVLKARFGLARCDLAVLANFWRRLPAARNYRRDNLSLNRQFPGEKFFAETQFSAD
jgi:GT2 family glycosyltransferase